jgi:hypothetical protein
MEVPTVLCFTGSENLIRITGCLLVPYTVLSHILLLSKRAVRDICFGGTTTGGSGVAFFLQSAKQKAKKIKIRMTVLFTFLN